MCSILKGFRDGGEEAVPVLVAEKRRRGTGDGPGAVRHQALPTRQAAAPTGKDVQYCGGVAAERALTASVVWRARANRIMDCASGGPMP